MVRKVLSTIRKFNMLEGCPTVAAAVSGGADSVAMLHALVELKAPLGTEIVVCHLDHGLRGPESRRDYEFVEALAQGLGLPFEGGTLPPGALKEHRGESLQAAAREERYAFLERAARKHGAGLLALGHTMDDQAETVIMRFLKGSATGGLSGMPAVGPGLIRPLLEVTREEVEAFLKERKIEYVQDSTNFKPVYLRNAIRLNLMPLIKKSFNPNIAPTLARSAAVLAHDDAFLNREAVSYYAAAVVTAAEKKITFDRRVLARIHPALATRVLLRAGRALEKKAVFLSSHLEACLSVITGPRPNAEVDLPGGMRFIREYERVYMSVEAPEDMVGFSAELNIPGTTTVEAAGLTVRTELLDNASGGPAQARDPLVACFDFSELPGPLELRSIRPGDRLRPKGMKGHKKLKDIFIDDKVPARIRPKVPVLLSGGEIIWAVGLRKTELYKVTPRSEKVLKVVCSGLEPTRKSHA